MGVWQKYGLDEAAVALQQALKTGRAAAVENFSGVEILYDPKVAFTLRVTCSTTH